MWHGLERAVSIWYANLIVGTSPVPVIGGPDTRPALHLMGTAARKIYSQRGHDALDRDNIEYTTRK